MVQKPFAISVRAARRMVEAARQRGLALVVCENARFNRPVRIAKWLIDRGDLGTPQMASSTALGTMWSPDKFVGNSAWRHRKLLGAGGASLDIGPHIFHRLRMLCGEVDSVAAFARVFEPTRYLRDASGAVVDTVTCDADDAFMAIASFESGAIAQLSFAFAGHGEPLSTVGPVLYGSRGAIKGETLMLDGEAPTTLDAYFARHGAADAETLFPLGLVRRLRAAAARLAHRDPRRPHRRDRRRGRPARPRRQLRHRRGLAGRPLGHAGRGAERRRRRLPARARRALRPAALRLLRPLSLCAGA